MKFLYVVHRYAPFPGGSEIYVQSMAEESHRRGHEVTVFAGEHQGDYNGITVTNNPAILLASWDLIIVHGGDVALQNFVLTNIKRIPSPILYLLILPSKSMPCLQGLSDAALIGCSTHQDWDHCIKHNVLNKAIQIRHGIKADNCVGISGFKNKHNISRRMFLSCGGYWPNKAMRELAQLFETANITNSVLVTTGYDNRMNLMPAKSSNVIPLLIDDRQELLSAIRDADCVLMHSYQEGFGLVLLEAMLNETPWIARNIAGAKLLGKFGKTYDNDQQLIDLLQGFNTNNFDVNKSRDYVTNNHLITNTVTDIESAIVSLKSKISRG
jgi:glycosyltransferase involved in cell wall biosynthesis